MFLFLEYLPRSMKTIVYFYMVVYLRELTIEATPIVNGITAKLGDVPYQVLIRIDEEYEYSICGGSIINDEWIVTAAHCFDISPKLSEIDIFAGVIDANNLDPNLGCNPLKLIKHENYTHRFDLSTGITIIDNDITLIKVDTKFYMSKYIRSISLPKQGQMTTVGAEAVISGWGTEEIDGSSSTMLRRATQTIVDHKSCENSLRDEGYKVLKTHICAQDEIDKSQPCEGDSGGPLTVNGTLVGIVSLACGAPEIPDLFTRVSAYVNWIERNMV